MTLRCPSCGSEMLTAGCPKCVQRIMTVGDIHELGPDSSPAKVIGHFAPDAYEAVPATCGVCQYWRVDCDNGLLLEPETDYPGQCCVDPKKENRFRKDPACVRGRVK